LVVSSVLIARYITENFSSILKIIAQSNLDNLRVLYRIELDADNIKMQFFSFKRGFFR